MMAFEVKSVLPVYALVVFYFFVLIGKFLLAPLKTLTNFKNSSSNPLKELVAAFIKPPVTVKLVPEPGWDSKTCSVIRP
jgi:hypothetical protein